MPASVNDTTVRGTDADDDGIRDDIEDLIEETYSDPETVRVAREFARGMQAALLAGDQSDPPDPVEALEISNAMSDMLFCLDAQGLDAIDQARFLHFETMNNEQRLEAYQRFDQALGGTVTRLPSDAEIQAACDIITEG